MRAAVDEFGRIDAVLNVAGIADAMMLADVTMEHYDRSWTSTCAACCSA